MTALSESHAPSLQSVCWACGQNVPAGSRLCHHCGAALPPANIPSDGDDRSNPSTGLGLETAQRRQLTVLFCDLVGSTALTTQLDPEDMRDRMRRYYGHCTEIAEQFGGEVSHVAGDGVVVNFGYPKAYEDAAERAVRAGLALTEKANRLEALSSMQVRVGIATGVMVVGDMIEVGNVREREFVGTPVNLAARLQTVAKPGTVVVSALTRNLIGRIFIYENLGDLDLKGFSAPIQAFAIVGENLATDRFAAHAGVALPPMVNRETERSLLLERWRKATDKCGQVAIVSGEPGIGKSRLVHDLREQISEEGHTFLGYSGSPLHQNSPLYPVAHQLRLTAGINGEDATEHRQAKLEAMLKSPFGLGSKELALIAELTASPESFEDFRSSISPGDRRERLLDTLIETFKGHARHQPVLVVFEDVQWFDATTLELVDRLARCVENLPILLLATFRTGLSVPWANLPHAVAIVLDPLDRDSCVSVIKGVLRNRSLPSNVTEAIVARTDGVPLFVEELTKSILEAEAKAAPAIGSSLSAVPETLRDTLMARLDRYPDARLIAQVAATIGREFRYELIAMIPRMTVAEILNALEELVKSGLIFQHGIPPRATYVFKHALVQDVAYESQLRRRRREVHGQIAKTLHSRFPDTPPEVVGHHYAEADEPDLAIDQFERAAEIARGRSANEEAAAHFSRALQLLRTLPNNLDRDQRERDLQIAYGAQLTAVQGNAASEVGAAYQRAMDLSADVNDPHLISKVLRGVHTFYIVRGELPKAHPIGERLLKVAERAEDKELIMQAHRPHGLCLLYMGELAAAQQHLDCAASLYDPVRYSHLRFYYSSDAGVLAHCNLAWVKWFLGFPDSALRHAEEAVTLSEKPKPHPHSQAFALSLAASLEQFMGEPERARRRADSVIELADRHHFAYWEPWGHIVRGWARVLMGESDAGVAEVQCGINAYRETESGLMCPYFQGLQADVLKRVNRIEDGLAAVNEALKLAVFGNIQFYGPELHCIKAELLAAADASIEERITCLRQALVLAEAQASRTHELRALTALCRELSNGTDRQRALERLQEVVDWFTEGQACRLLTEASKVLETATFEHA